MLLRNARTVYLDIQQINSIIVAYCPPQEEEEEGVGVVGHQGVEVGQWESLGESLMCLEYVMLVSDGTE